MCGGSMERPPQERAPTKFVGLANQGATCYLNSLLQTCFMTPEIRETIFSVGREDMHYTGALKGNEWLDGDSELYMPCELQRLLAYMQEANVDGLQTDALTHSFGWSGNDTDTHHDLQELMRILFENLEEHLPEHDRHRVKNIYTGSLVQEVRCLVCSNRSIREEHFGDLNITVDGFSSLDASLSAFAAPESLVGENRYKCEKCNQLVDAQKQIRLRKLSQVMILSLGRFRFNWEREDGVREKITDRFTFPQELDFAAYMENPTADEQSTCYELFSVIIHKGGANSGHYHAIIKDLHGQGVWEAAVAKAEEAGATSAWGQAGSSGREAGDGAAKSGWGKIGSKLAGVADSGGAEYVVEDYMERPELLIRDIVTQFEAMSGDANQKGMMLKDVETEITEQTGVPWTKRYKPVHGTMRDFIESKPHLFDVTGPRISVVEGARWDEQPTPAERAVVQPPSPAPAPPSAWGCADAVGGAGSAAKISWAQRAAKSTPVECTEKCWFDFNDMNITPVSVKELDKYCEGSECAYVLFYRRKPFGDCHAGTPRASIPKLPSHMENEVLDFNKNVHESRNRYQEKVSHVTVTCYPASSLGYDGVALSPIGPSFPVKIDRRWNIEKVKSVFWDELVQQYEKSSNTVGATEVDAGRQAVVLHLLRNCVAPSSAGAQDFAMHVYELIGPEHDLSASLGTRVKDGLSILLWDGCGAKLKWQDLCVGPESEALALSVSFLKPTPAHRNSAPATVSSPNTEAKGVWGGGGASAVGVVSGITGSAGEDEADGPPPEGVRLLARKDWTLGRLRAILRERLRESLRDSNEYTHDAIAESNPIIIHRLDRSPPLSGNRPMLLDSRDDTKTLGELQLKESTWCWLGVEFASGEVPRAFKAFKWTQGGMTRLCVELPVPESSAVLTAFIDIEWDTKVSEAKKNLLTKLKVQIKALTPAEQKAIAMSTDNSVAMSAKSTKRELRLLLLGRGWGEQGFLVTDETTTMRDIFRPYNNFDDEADLAPLPVSIKARLVHSATSSSAAVGNYDQQTGPVVLQTALVVEGRRTSLQTVDLQREMTVQQCRQLLARALKIENYQDYHLTSTNWSGDADIEVEEDTSTTLGSVMNALKIKEKEIILLEPGPPRAPLPTGYARIFVWQHAPAKRETLLAECDGKLTLGRPDGQHMISQFVFSQDESMEALRHHVWHTCCDKLAPGTDKDKATPPPGNLILRARDTAGRVRNVLRNLEQKLSKAKLSTSVGGMHVVAQMVAISDNQILCGASGAGAGSPAAMAMSDGAVLVYMAKRNCNDRTYHEPREVLLACGPQPKLSDLAELASRATGIEVGDVVLAKYVICKDGRCEWKRLDNAVQGKGKTGKTNSFKILVRQPPISLSDGDVIGVKSRLDDPEDRDDFVTKQGQVPDKNAGAKSGDKGPNGKDKRTETPITMTVKKPSRAPVTPQDGVTPQDSAPAHAGSGVGVGASPGGMGYSEGNVESHTPNSAWGVAAHLNHANPGVAAVSSPSMGAWAMAGGRALVAKTNVMESPGAGGVVMNGMSSDGPHVNGWMGSGAAIVAAGPQMNGGHNQRSDLQETEDDEMFADLLQAVFPGLTRTTAVKVHREGVAAAGSAASAMV